MLTEHDAMEDESIISRNKYMVNSIINFMNEKSIFSAVGAAHLPGKYGIIKLLRDKGYKVSMVDATFTGVADNYKIDYNKMLWYRHKNQDLGYSLELPSKPNDSTDFESFNIYSHRGVMNDELLSFFAMDSRRLVLDGKSEEFITKMIDNSTKQLSGRLVKKDTLNIPDGYGYKTLTKLPDSSYIASKVVIKNKIMYYLFANTQAENATSPYSDRFFKSLQFHEPKPLAKIEDKPWVKYENKDGAFELMLPVNAEDISRTAPNPQDPEDSEYIINLYRSIDYKNRNNYIFRYNDMPIGYYLQDLEEGYSGLETNFRNTSTLVGEPKPISIQGYEGKEYELYIQGKYHAICRVYFKGNRIYLLLKQKLNETDKVSTDDAFFNSFKIIDTKKPELTTYIHDDAFSVLMFKNQKIVEDNSIENTSYIGDSVEAYQINDANGDVAFFGHHDLKKYFKIKNLDDFYKTYLNTMVTYKDTIISESKIKIGNIDGAETLIKNKSTGLFYRHKLWLNDNQLYHLYLYAEEEHTKNNLADSLYNSFKVLKKGKPSDIYSSKTDLILEDLKSKDTLVRKSALGAFDYYEFEKEDINRLFKALNEKLDSDDGFRHNVKNIIISEFSNINDSTTVSRLKEQYLNVLKSEQLRLETLNVIKSLDYDDAIPSYFELFAKLPPQDDDQHTWSVLSPFRDSLALSVDNYSSLLKVLPLKSYRQNVLDISTDILEDKTLNHKVIIDNIESLLSYAEQDLNNYLKELDDDEKKYNSNFLIQSYLSFFTVLKGNEDRIDRFTGKLKNLKDQKWIEFLALKTRLIHNLKVDKNIVKQRFEDMYSRFELIEVYHKSNQFQKVPKKYLGPVEVAKLSLYNYLGDENGYPKTINLLETFVRDDKKYAAFEFAYEEDKNTYIGIVGPLEELTADSELKRWKCYSDWNKKEDNWKAQVQLLMDSFNDNGY
jgi:hypothetical protein